VNANRLSIRQRELITKLAIGEKVSDGRSMPSLVEAGLVVEGARGPRLTPAGRQIAYSLKEKRTRRCGACKIVLWGCHV
jgi:hypothetical protein